MSHIYAAAFPVLPGQSHRVRDFAQELAPHLAEWDRLCREGTFRFYNVTLQAGPAGDLGVHCFEIEDPSKVRTRFTDSAHDRWWTSYLLEVHGIDVRHGSPPPPPTVFTWRPSRP